MLSKESPKRLPRHTPDKLAHRPAKIHHMIAIARARLPERLLRLKARDHIVPLKKPAIFDGLTKGRHAAFMVQHHLNRSVLFSILREFWPIVFDQRHRVQLALIDENVCANRRRRFRAGKDDGHSVLRPSLTGSIVSQTAPQINQRLSVHAQTNRCAHFAALGKIAFKFISNSLEFWV